MKGKTPCEKQDAIITMTSELLTELYQQKPEIKKEIENAPGYAAFSNVNINIVFASLSGGFGMVHNNNTSKNTYMKMGEVGIGLGLGVKDFRAVFVFHDAETMHRFVTHGWTAGVHADAGAKASNSGHAVSAEYILDNITVYQLTKSGLALQATLKGTKYWQDKALNK